MTYVKPLSGHGEGMAAHSKATQKRLKGDTPDRRDKNKAATAALFV